MRKIFLPLVLLSFFVRSQASAQTGSLPADTVHLRKIREVGEQQSQVMEILANLTDVNGPRLSFSPGYRNAAAYARTMMEEWGLANVAFDGFGERGRGWRVERFHLHALEPSYFPLIGYPKAWSPGLRKSVSGRVVYLNANSAEELSAYKGTLKGKFVIMDLPPVIKPAWKPFASRLADSTLLQYANSVPSPSGRRYPLGSPENITYQKWKLLLDEGAVAVLSPGTGRGDNGSVLVSAAYFPIPPDTPPAARPRPFSPDVPETLPQVVLATEHYNRIFRLVQRDIPVTVELALTVEFENAEEGYNVIGEIPGTDLREEVVMIGAHLDSWHSGTGTTDNGVGAAVCLEAIRLIKALGIAPRRTIRIALWGGEEQGLLGSSGYVKKHLMDEAAAQRFSVYFNMDNGTGKFRGIYLQGNENARALFSTWFVPFHRQGAATLTSRNTGGTDHLSFTGIGLPGFQFIQDPVEYGTRTHHSNLDVYDKAVGEDLIHNAVIMATFAWRAANLETLFPRK